MTIAPSLLMTLAADMAHAAWSTPTLTFWDATARSLPGVEPTPALLHGLQQEFSRGRWSPGTLRLLQAVLPTATPSVFRTLQQEFRSGQWGSLTLRIMEGL